jgi:putative transposase
MRLVRCATPTQGARSNHKNLTSEPVDHALGRSRGGLSTKIHALTDLFCCPLTVLLSAGQAGDNPYLRPLLTAHRDGQTETFRLLADKAYSHPSTRQQLRAAKISHTIPERSDQIARRKNKGSVGGRPPGFDPETYKHRNTVERGFGRLKQWRAIATRYDKYATTYLGGVLLACVITHHRVRN